MRPWLKLVAAALCMLAAAGLSTPGTALAKRGISIQSAKKDDSGRRVALVIGNGDYRTGRLRNPANDAKSVAGALRQLGFSVTEKTNLDQRGMERAISLFGRQLPEKGVALFYYAGHGVQINGRNYLIPLGKEITDAADVKYDAVDAGRVVDRMEAGGAKLNIVILDACRDNPFRGLRSGNRGLAPMTGGSGTIIAFATSPGSYAADGSGENGVYTGALVKNLVRPGLTVEQVFKLTAAQVHKRQPSQVPWFTSSFTGTFHFRPIAPPPSRMPGTDELKPLEEQARRKAAWESWQKSMEAYWQKLDELDATSLAAREKAKAWQGALAKFGDDNPFGGSDEFLRKQAKERVGFWEDRAVAESLAAEKARERARAEAEQRKKAAEKARIEAEAERRRIAEEKARIEAEAERRRIAEEKVRIEAEAERIAEEKARAEAEREKQEQKAAEAGRVREGTASAGMQPPGVRFTKADDGVITDHDTGLQWYVGPDRQTNWFDASKWVEGLKAAGGGWRMPSLGELALLYQEGEGSRNIDPVFHISGWFVWAGEDFANKNFVWSGGAQMPRRAWVFNFWSGGNRLVPSAEYGLDLSSTQTRPKYFWAFAVRSSPKKPAGQKPGARPPKRFTKNSGGVITDHKTGLQWYVGPDKGTNWNEASDWAGNLEVAGGGWRLPTRRELKGIVKKGSRRGTLKYLPPVFDATGHWVWSGEGANKRFSSAWYMDLKTGGESGGHLSLDLSAFAVRPVPRGEAGYRGGSVKFGAFRDEEN